VFGLEPPSGKKGENKIAFRVKRVIKHKLFFFFRHHVRTMKKWQESHQSVELISVRNTMINMEENNNDSPPINLQQSM